jgi:two-component system response regulator RegX3
MPHILLIDDDRALTDPLKVALENAGYTVSVAHDGQSGLNMALDKQPDVIVLDVIMPVLNGWEVCQSIRQHSPVPIIMLTALDDRTDRIRGLELGADDYLVKPFGFLELQAHIKAMLRRVTLDTQLPQTLAAGDIQVNLATHTVTLGGQPVSLRQKEYDILVLLMSNADRVVTRNELFDVVWGTDWMGDTRTLDVHMSWLRSKLEADPATPVYFQTVRGIGYRFVMPGAANE